MKTAPRIPSIPPPDRDSDRDLAGALHEVSNALTVVLGWLDQARAGAMNSSAQPELLEAVNVAYAHASLGHSIARRAVGAALEEGPEVRSSVRLVRRVVRGVAPIAARRKIGIDVKEAPEDGMVAHATAVQQILLNLVLNALSFTPEGLQIEVSVKVRGKRVWIRVQDSGPGVPEQGREQLFSRGHSMRPGGAGIGLSHAHALAKSRGGELRLVGGGTGACFELGWPLEEAPSAATTQSKPAPTNDNLRGMRVVALEDDPAVMSLLELGLQARGADLVALGSRSALEQFSAVNDTGGRPLGKEKSADYP